MVTTSDSPAPRIQPGPVRTCVGCRTKAAKGELLRVIAGSDSEGRPAVVPDPAGTASGRGAHLHPTSECYELAERRRAFTRALRPKKVGDQVGLSSVPLRTYLDSQNPAPQTNANDQRNWSTSS